MIVLPRAVARAFRTVVRKCHPGRPRGPAPPVTVRQHEGRLTLHADLGEVFLSWTGPAGTESEAMIVPMTLVDAIDGPGDDPIQVERDGATQAVARWVDRGVPRSFACELVAVRENHALPEPPEEWVVVGPEFLTALHEAGRTAAKEPSRFALQRIQVRGKKGQIIGTDGKRAYLRSGFPLPFPDDLLVPAIPVFGARDLAPRDNARVGRTDTHLVVTVGLWVVGLKIDADGKYPDVAGALPRHAPSVVGIDDSDAAALMEALPGLPGEEVENQPVTLDVDRGVWVRAGADAGAIEIALTRSTFAGPPVRVAFVRNDLKRLLVLGCRTLRIAGPEKPVVGEADRLTFATMPLEASSAVPSIPTATRLETDDVGRVVPRTGTLDPPVTIPLPPLEERSVMKPTVPPPPPEPNGEALDPLVEAEGLRAALADVATRATRLVAALRHLRKEKKALASVWSSLQQLNLGA